MIMRAVGLMSGTSMDGVDIALIETDGEHIENILAAGGRPYAPYERKIIRAAMDAAASINDRYDRPGIMREAEAMLTEIHAETVEDFLAQQELLPEHIDVVGFHGQTVLHRPQDGLTVQLGNGQQLADRLGIEVIYDFRAHDVAMGGQGAPLVPLYHRALTHYTQMQRPAAVVNIGGVANVTWIGEDDSILAFDTGPGNALIDDWMLRETGSAMDENGHLAAHGKADHKRLQTLLNHPYFLQKPPKSLDRNTFSLSSMDGLSPADGAATLTAFTAASLVCAVAHFPKPPEIIVLAGGGAYNATLRGALKKLLPGQVILADELGWSADTVEAQAFAYLAVRSWRGMPLTFPSTTGVPEPTTGGVHVYPEDLELMELADGGDN
ncbi:MAG: anhydro-N-acetylmuramic acid kinase [Alphaproteobacteria bacterium]